MRGRSWCLYFADIITYPLAQTLFTGAPRLKVLLNYQSEKIGNLANKVKNFYDITTHTDLFTGEGAIILVVPSFSPFSMFAVILFMLFDPSNKAKGKMMTKGESEKKNTKT